jgi:hypothetical protein
MPERLREEHRFGQTDELAVQRRLRGGRLGSHQHLLPGLGVADGDQRQLPRNREHGEPHRPLQPRRRVQHLKRPVGVHAPDEMGVRLRVRRRPTQQNLGGTRIRDRPLPQTTLDLGVSGRLAWAAGCAGTPTSPGNGSSGADGTLPKGTKQRGPVAPGGRPDARRTRRSQGGSSAA